MADIDAVISLLHVGNQKFQLVGQGSIDKYLALVICDIDCNTFEMVQPFLICWILELLSLDEHKTKGHNTPVGKPLLHCDLDGVPHKHPWLSSSLGGAKNYCYQRYFVPYKICIVSFHSRTTMFLWHQ
jgi:hypothetical protein